MYKSDILRALFEANAITFRQLTGAEPADAEIAAFSAGQAYCDASELMDKEEEIDRLESDLRDMEMEKDDAVTEADDLRDALRALVELVSAEIEDPDKKRERFAAIIGDAKKALGEVMK